MSEPVEPALPEPEPDVVRRHDAKQLAVVALVCFLVGLLSMVVLNQLEGKRALRRVARARADMRMLATAIETYYVDNMQYPAAATAGSVDTAPLPKGWPRTRTFMAPNRGMSTITTPIGYITGYPDDPFASTSGLTYRYFTDRRGGWILGSFGPDQDEQTGGDLQWQRPIAVYRGDISQPSPELLSGSHPLAPPGSTYTYDPTNGTYSEGDVWRIKQ